MNYTKFPLVEILWDDAATDTEGWEDPDDLEDVSIDRVMTVGFLVKESEAGLLIASTVCAEDTCNSRIKIPRNMVVAIRYLRNRPKVKNGNTNRKRNSARPAVLAGQPDPTPVAVSESGSGVVRNTPGAAGA